MNFLLLVRAILLNPGSAVCGEGCILYKKGSGEGK
jgi:hypothetical protein